jgi:hypothetical protein
MTSHVNDLENKRQSRMDNPEGMVAGVTTACVINAYHHYSCEFEPFSWRGVLDTTLCDKVYQ